MREFLPITLLAAGQVAEIWQLIGPPEAIRRFEELGLRAGARIEIVRGGSPCIIRVGGSRLCFREDAQVQVLVAPRKTA
ncbi:MAG TPA: FeoA domain-containing protein [Lacipirellulaceae bacterium]